MEGPIANRFDSGPAFAAARDLADLPFALVRGPARVALSRLSLSGHVRTAAFRAGLLSPRKQDSYLGGRNAKACPDCEQQREAS